MVFEERRLDNMGGGKGGAGGHKEEAGGFSLHKIYISYLQVKLWDPFIQVIVTPNKVCQCATTFQTFQG